MAAFFEAGITTIGDFTEINYCIMNNNHKTSANKVYINTQITIGRKNDVCI